MIKRQTKSISISVLAVLVTLLCLLMASIGIGHAWFTSSHKHGIQLVVQVGALNVKLYQVSGSTSTEVYTNNENLTSSSPSYVVLDKEIMPDEFNSLELKLENADAGSNLHVRFRFLLYACGYSSDTLVGTDLTLGTNMVKSGDYYCYMNSSNSYLEFANEDTITLLTGFTIPYSSFKAFTNSETLKLVLQIEYATASVGF